MSEEVEYIDYDGGYEERQPVDRSAIVQARNQLIEARATGRSDNWVMTYDPLDLPTSFVIAKQGLDEAKGEALQESFRKATALNTMQPMAGQGAYDRINTIQTETGKMHIGMKSSYSFGHHDFIVLPRTFRAVSPGFEGILHVSDESAVVVIGGLEYTLRSQAQYNRSSLKQVPMFMRQHSVAIHRGTQRDRHQKHIDLFAIEPQANSTEQVRANGLFEQTLQHIESYAQGDKGRLALFNNADEVFALPTREISGAVMDMQVHSNELGGGNIIMHLSRSDNPGQSGAVAMNLWEALFDGLAGTIHQDEVEDLRYQLAQSFTLTMAEVTGKRGKEIVIETDIPGTEKVLPSDTNKHYGKLITATNSIVEQYFTALKNGETPDTKTLYTRRQELKRPTRFQRFLGWLSTQL